MKDRRVEGEKMKKNYKLHITNKVAHELHELPRIEATSNQKFLQGGSWNYEL